MYTGKTLFAQLMDFLPWKTFARIVDRYGGNHRIRTLACTEYFRVLAFAQLTYRESLRDIEAVLSAQSVKLYHMGIRGPVRRSTLADASERRDAQFSPRFRRQTARCQRARSVDTGTRCNLCDGRGLPRLRAALGPSPRRCLLRHPRQGERRPATGLFGTERPGTRDRLRSDGGAVGFLQQQTLPSPFAPHSLQGFAIAQDAHLLDQKSIYMGSKMLVISSSSSQLAKQRFIS